MDFIVDLPPSNGYTTILVVVDRFSKMSHFIATKTIPSAKDTATIFIKEIFRLHGLPETIVTDRGTQFTAKFWLEFCKGLHIKRSLSTAYHPQANGQTERTNATLEQYLRCFVTYLQSDWNDLLPIAEFVYNNQIHKSTSMTPFFINTGRHPSMLPGSSLYTPCPAVNDRLQSISEITNKVKRMLQRAQWRCKIYADRKRTPAPLYEEGHRVWLSTRYIKLNCPSKKLGPRFLGPYVIETVLSPTTVRLRLPASLKIHPVFHVSLIKPQTTDPFIHRTLPPPGPISA
uniref:Integrase catalytic domain-containing protein n=1 Tax=Leptobrachium leishanense TaxID=445787 RepID=A0A8C5MRU9_9ANUR